MGDEDGRRDMLNNTIQYNTHVRTDAVGESPGSAGIGDRFGLGMGNELEVLVPSNFFFLPPASCCLS